MQACKLRWCEEKCTYVGDDGDEGNIVDDDWFDGEETLDLEVSKGGIRRGDGSEG